MLVDDAIYYLPLVFREKRCGEDAMRRDTQLPDIVSIAEYTALPLLSRPNAESCAYFTITFTGDAKKSPHHHQLTGLELCQFRRRILREMFTFKIIKH